MITAYDHEPFAKCPHCGHCDEASWELDGESGVTECPRCGKEYAWVRHTEITYSTVSDVTENADPT